MLSQLKTFFLGAGASLFTADGRGALPKPAVFAPVNLELAAQ
jgi:hypothetical protein